MSSRVPADLAAWLRAFRDLGVEYLDLPGDRRASASRPASGELAAEDPGAMAPPASTPPRRERPAGERNPLRGPFPAHLQVLAAPDLEPLLDIPAGDPGLAAIRSVLGNCTRCRLHAERTNLVFGVGNPEADILFVGEGPGRDEDLQGEPFVGRAGRKLNEMIRSMGYRREEVYIANVVKCRPPNNRTPQQEEADTCSPFLHAQIAAIRPTVIVTLGLPAAQALLGSCPSMKSVRGRFHEYRGVPVLPTYHPAYLLRSPGENRKVAHDLALVMRHLNRELPPWAAKALREDAP